MSFRGYYCAWPFRACAGTVMARRWCLFFQVAATTRENKGFFADCYVETYGSGGWHCESSLSNFLDEVLLFRVDLTAFPVMLSRFCVCAGHCDGKALVFSSFVLLLCQDVDLSFWWMVLREYFF